ncbi:hypothetical protein KDA_04170 [Dictyobacter alpinus]|uniref:Uncharacterized protein n=1 Tax=Dictyobacter alpinus TaxID=2014873 RepID=A0A402B0Q9_9CHLR|nr:hypothetical protein KDA_04170 [Dictyobacter alpinus]
MMVACFKALTLPVSIENNASNTHTVIEAQDSLHEINISVVSMQAIFVLEADL